MRYLRMFEEIYKEKCYWLVPTDGRLRESLEELGCDNNFIEMMVINNNIKTPYIYIGFNPDASRITQSMSDKWGWNHYLGTVQDEYFNSSGYTYMGRININDYEMDQNKYNL